LNLTDPIAVTIGAGGANDGGPIDGPPAARDRVEGSVEDVEAFGGGNIQLFGNEADNRLRAFGSSPGVSAIVGKGGNDRLVGSGLEDTIEGGAGSDWMEAFAGTDKVYAKDGARDRRIDCGEGADLAEVDKKDPKPISC